MARCYLLTDQRIAEYGDGVNGATSCGRGEYEVGGHVGSAREVGFMPVVGFCIKPTSRARPRGGQISVENGPRKAILAVRKRKTAFGGRKSKCGGLRRRETRRNGPGTVKNGLETAENYEIREKLEMGMKSDRSDPSVLSGMKKSWISGLKGRKGLENGHLEPQIAPVSQWLSQQEVTKAG